MRPSVRRLTLSVLTLVLVLGALEAIAYLSFTVGLRGKHFRQRDLDAFGATPPSQAEMDEWRLWGWDRELGWLRRPRSTERITDEHGSWSLAIDERGARREPFQGPGGLVSVYGDSFSFGFEVNDDETWPHYLSERLGSRVDNWAHSAWGPDQALLRLRRNLPRERTTVIVLAILSENIVRLLNAYRPFLTGDRSMPMAFKPMLTAEHGRVAWLPNPLERADTPADWIQAFERARATDHWYAVNREKIQPHFPYLLSLFDTGVYLVRHPERPNLYEDPDAVARLDYVLAEFEQLANQHAFAPVVLFIPEPSDLGRFVAGRPTRYQDYVAELRRRSAGTRLVVVDLLDHPFDPARFNRRPFKDHPSPYGHQVIAEVVHNTLKARGLLP